MEKEKKSAIPETLKNDISNMCEALSRALRFMTKVINDDTAYFEKYYKLHGDIRWRPKIANSAEVGEPTEVDMIMKADSLGLPIKRLIDTIGIIEQKLGGVEKDSSYFPIEEKLHEEDYESRAARLLEEASKKKES